MAYNQYDEGIASRSAQFRGGAVGGNIANGALPSNSSTAGGGNQVIATSSDIDGRSQLDTPRSTNNIPDDPNANVSSNKSVAGVPLTVGVKNAVTGNPAGVGVTVNGVTPIMTASSSFGGSDITR